jgi:hypothetical protein
MCWRGKKTLEAAAVRRALEDQPLPTANFFFFFLMNELVRLAVKDVLSIAFANEFAVKALAVVCWVVFLSFFF